MIPIYKVFLPEASIKYAHDAIDSTWISSIGKYIDLATDRLREVTGSKYVILVNNGTSATHLVAKTLRKFRPHLRRLHVPSACFVAVYNSLLYDGYDWDINCFDLNLETWNMEIDDVKPEDAIFVVHNLGNIMNVPKLISQHKCTIVEDNCEGFLGTYSNKQSGTEALCSAMSFFGNKNVTSGEGGAFYTNDQEIYNYITKIKGQGQSEKRYIHDELGYNYRMTNIQAALLLGQLENLQELKQKKIDVVEQYKYFLRNVENIVFQKTENDSEHSNWMFAIRFINLSSYDIAKEYFDIWGIETRPMFYPYTFHKYLHLEGKYENAQIINNSIVVLPSHPLLTADEIKYICQKIMSFSKIIEKKDVVLHD